VRCCGTWTARWWTRSRPGPGYRSRRRDTADLTALFKRPREETARIGRENAAATLEDLGSKNGTLLGNRPVRGRVELHNADRIQVASELLVYHVSGRGVSTATQPIPLSESDRGR